MKLIRHSIVLRLLLIISVVMACAYSFSFAQNSLINIANGGNVYFSNGAIVKINGGITNANSAKMTINGAIIISGNWINNGTQIANSGIVEFFGADTTEIVGTGTTQFYKLLLNKQSKAVELRLNTGLTNTPSGFLELQSGTFKIIGSYAFTQEFFSIQLGEITIPNVAGFWLDNPNVTVSSQSASIILNGLLRVSNGIFNLGNSAGNSLKYNSDTDPAELIIEGGEFNIYSGILSNSYPLINKPIKFKQTSGILKLGNGGISADKPVFEINAPSSIFEMSGGTIQLVNHTVAAGVDEFSILCDSNKVSAGNLVIQPNFAGEEFILNSKSPIGNLEMIAEHSPTVRLNGNKLTVLNNITIAGDGTNRFIQNGYDVQLGGNWNHNITNVLGLNQGSNSIIFSGAAIQNINSPNINPVFNKLILNKTAEKVNMNKPMRITHSIRLLGTRAILDMGANDLTFSSSANIFSDLAGTQSLTTSFGFSKYIINSGSDTDPLIGAGLVKELSPTSTLPLTLTYPIGTASGYSPAEVKLEIAGATFAANPKIRVKVVPKEHPAVEVTGKSLKRYWNISTEDVNVLSQGATVKFYYIATDAAGSEGNYRVLLFAPPWNIAGGFWRVDPGRNDDVVKFNEMLFYSQQTDTIVGDWTAGEPDVARAIYYSRADGDYNNPTTWSKLSYGGAVSNTAPNKRSDEVRIQGNTVTVTANTAPAKLISVETGQDGRTGGILKFTNETYAVGDTFRVQSGATVYMGSAVGISPYPNATGNVRTLVRDFSNEGIYGFWGGAEQTPGAAVPNLITGLIVDKTANTKLTLDKNTAISGFLRINQGTLDMSSYTLNGNSSGRVFTMNGGEFIIPAAFPSNYLAPTFSAGRITFVGDGNITIPSSLSTPGITQYYDLKIGSPLRSGNITFSGQGEISILNSFDISEMNFADATYRFFTDGSTFRFKKNGGIQDIPFKPNSPNDAVCYLKYYNLIIDGSGTKQLNAIGASSFSILKNLTIDNNAQFSANNLDIEIYGNWLNKSGAFVGGTSKVTFHSDVATVATTITSRSATDNVFNSVIFTGAGIVDLLDNFRANGSVTIDTLTTLKANANTITVLGDWSNLGGNFSYGTSTVRLEGTVPQNITKTSGNINFYNLVVKNLNSVNATAIGGVTNGTKIFNNLSLEQGNIRSHIASDYRYIELAGTITRAGGGYVDGELRKIVPVAANTVTYEVGHGNSYTPVTLDFNGPGGTSGLLAVMSDTVTSSSSPISWADAVPSSILPAGSSLSPSQHIARQYRITIPSTSAFVLGNNRSYDVKMNFISGAVPNGDIRNSADPNQFDVALYNGTSWILAFAYGTAAPVIADRNASYTKMAKLKDFGSIIIGMPNLLTYYSRGTGNWNDNNNWSQQKYNGAPSATYPGQVGPTFNAYIAEGHKLTMQADVTVNTPGLVLLDSVGVGGALMTNGYVLSGSGTFRMLDQSALGIGDAAGITSSGANGSIRTNTRDYNYQKHQGGTFIYTGGLAQSTGNGLPSAPDSIASLIINKSANTLTVNSAGNLQIRDSLYIQSGSFSLSGTAGRNLYLFGNMRKASGATFIPNSRAVYLRGENPINLTSENYNEPIDFYQLLIFKNQNTGHIVLGPNTNLNITNNLTFETNNRVIIDATSNSTALNPLYVQFTGAATISNANPINLTLWGGWVYGEVRKNVAVADAAAVKFETGTDIYYSPFTVDFRAGSANNGTAGYLSAKAIEGSHPKLYSDPLNLYPVNKTRNITVYWRLTKPVSSTFARGDRPVDFIVSFKNPEQQTNTDCYGCAEISYYRGGDSLQWWQGMYFLGGGQNSQGTSGTGGTCSDTRLQPQPTPTFTYGGEGCGAVGALGTIRVNSVNTALGSQEFLPNGDLLLGDFVAGNRNSLKYYSFYSIKDGDWSDPTTWSTDGYNGTVNAAASDSDSLIRPVPFRQYDNVYVGNGKKVRLDMFVGTNVRNNVLTMPFAGPSVFVERTGVLDFGTSVLRGNQFNALSGATLIIGSNGGITNVQASYVGNVQIDQISATPKFSDSINVVYAPTGRTIDRYQFTPVRRNGLTHYIESVTIKKASNDSVIMSYSSGNKFRLPDYSHIIAPASAELEAGQTYYIEVNPSDVGNSRRYEAWANWNFDGTTFLDVANATSSNNNLVTLPVFTVPAANGQGSTLLRIGISGNASDITATSANATAATSGEFEDYTIHIKNSTYVANQVTGPGLPTLLRSFEVNSPNLAASNPTVTLQKPIIVLDSLKLSNSALSVGTNDITLKGDMINNSVNGFTNVNNSMVLIDNKKNKFRGSSGIILNNLTLRKTADSVNVLTDLKINGNLVIDSNNCVNLSDNKTITFGANSSILGRTPDKSRMIKVSGIASATDSSGKIVKEFPTATATARSFTFPVGVDTVYNPANINLTADYSGSPSLSLQLINTKHPKRLTDNILEKYWKLQATGISNITASNYKFYYDYFRDVNGDTSKYIPGRYASTWEINLGLNPIGKISPITITNEKSISGDWTVGEPYVYYAGRVFFSINSGTWNEKFNWSTDTLLKHLGPASSYFPGQLYADDTVNVDGHTMRFEDSLHISIDSLRMGGTNPNGVAGRVLFGAANRNKVFETRSIFMDNDNCDIDIDGNIGADTIIVKNYLINNSPVGLRLRADNNNYIGLKFIGSNNMEIGGTGKWTSLADVFMKKDDGLADTLIINSSSFVTATNTANNYLYHPESGVIRNDLNMDLYLSCEGKLVDMSINSGIDVRKGRTLTKQGLSTNSNTTININGGKLVVGNEPNEHLLYKSGTKVNLKSGKLVVAGGFAKSAPNSTVDVSIDTLGEIAVNTIGNSSTEYAGFDISNAGSAFSMNGGRLIIANAGGTSFVQADLRINAQSINGTGMTGGVIQSGDTTLTPNGTVIKIAGSMPLYDLHFANNLANALNTNIVEQIVTVKNNWSIDENHTFNLTGNTVVLGGNLTNHGLFVGPTGGGTANPWLVEFNGVADQTIYNAIGRGLELYNFRLNKPSGNLLLDVNGNSNLIVKNSIEFTDPNMAVISTQNNDNRYVELSPLPGGDNPQFLRTGLGHIDGWFYRWITNTASSRIFHIGALSSDSYHPATFQTLSASNTAGLIGAKFTDSNHTAIGGSIVDPNTNINKYWTIKTVSTETAPANNAFALGVGQTYNLTLQFLNPGDLKPGANPLNFEQYIYSPALPSIGTWTTLETPDKVANTSKSILNTNYGDFVIGEPSGVTFYSIQSGQWNDVNTWSMTDYETPDVPSRYPSLNTDIVRIGNGKKVILEPIMPEVRSLIVEKHNGIPGYLQINGDLGYIRGTSFSLEDDCTIGIQHTNGINIPSDRPKGAIVTASSTFGISRYIYNGIYGSQAAGDALPNTVKSLIVDNPSATRNILYLNTSTVLELNVNDTLLIRQGTFHTGGRNVNIRNTFAVDSVVNDGTLEATTSRINFTGGGTKHIDIGNYSGIRFNDIRLDNSNLLAKITTDRKSPLAQVYVANSLIFNTSGLFMLGDSLHLIIENTDPAAIVNYGTNRFVSTSNVSGLFIRKILPSISYIFPVGSRESGTDYYAPMEFTAQAGTIGGSLGVRTSWGKGVNNSHSKLSGANSSQAKYLKRYWAIDSVTAQLSGKLKFQYNDNDFSAGATEADMLKVGRWNPSKERSPGEWIHPGDLILNAGNNTFETDANFAFAGFTGDWLMGNNQAFRRIFFSRQNGDWDIDESWTFNENHIGDISGLGLYPNAEKDSVVIGAGHIISLKMTNPFAVGDGVGIALGTSAVDNGTLNLNANILNGDYFTMAENSTLGIGSPDGIALLGTNSGNIQTQIVRQFNPLANYVYNGMVNQVIGTGLPSTINNLTIDNTGDNSINDNNVILDRDLTIANNLTVNTGALNLVTYRADKLVSTGIFSAASGAFVRIAGTKNMADLLSNYATYNINDASIFNFYGTDQVISTLPIGYTNGFGIVTLQNAGNKSVNAPLLIRGDLYISNDATLLNGVGVDALSVRKNIFNSATVNNSGVIEIGM